jgi:hypothetical protein
MKKRQLTNEEKALTTRNISVSEKDLAYLHAIMRQNQLAIEIAPIIYEKQLSDMRNKQLEYEQRIKELEFVISTSKNQIKNGVDIK